MSLSRLQLTSQLALLPGENTTPGSEHMPGGHEVCLLHLASSRQRDTLRKMEEVAGVVGRFNML